MVYEKFDRNFGLQGKVALITGCASGIGKATVELFAEKGASIILVDLKESIHEVAQSLSKYNISTLSFAVDLTRKENIEKIVAESISKFGKIDILINNAGAVMLDDAENLPEEYWDQQMAINAKAPFLLSQCVGREMIKSGGGKIVNVASQASFIAIENHVAYSASKAALVIMTKILALEWAGFNINVNAVSPTVVLTEMGEKAWPGDVGEAMKKTIPVGRFAYPDEIAASILFLSCDASNMITGENLVIDGGFTIK